MPRSASPNPPPPDAVPGDAAPPTAAPDSPLPADAGRVLLPLARAAIGTRLRLTLPWPDTSAAWLAAPGAAFVTLHHGGRLRGCIGSLTAYRPLRDDVEGNAVASAFRDPRFPPVEVEEFAGLRIEVSVLSPPEPLPVRTEAEALATLRPGIDGIILEAQDGRATFLPQVWDDLPEPRIFLRRLRLKARLPEDYWGPDVRLSRYAVTAWEEPER